MTKTCSRLGALGLCAGLLGACGSIQDVEIEAVPGGQPTFKADVDRGIYDVIRDVRLEYRVGTAAPVTVPKETIGGGGGGRYRTYEYIAPETAPAGTLLDSTWTVEFTQGEKQRSAQLVLAAHDLAIDEVTFVEAATGDPLEPLPTGGYALQSGVPVLARVMISNSAAPVGTVELNAQVASSSPDLQDFPDVSANLPGGLAADATATVEMGPFTFEVQNFASGTIVFSFQNNVGDADPSNDEQNVGIVVQP